MATIKNKCSYCGKICESESEDICIECMYEYVDNWLTKLYGGKR